MKKRAKKRELMEKRPFQIYAYGRCFFTWLCCFDFARIYINMYECIFMVNYCLFVVLRLIVALIKAFCRCSLVLSFQFSLSFIIHSSRRGFFLLSLPLFLSREPMFSSISMKYVLNTSIAHRHTHSHRTLAYILHKLIRSIAATSGDKE